MRYDVGGRAQVLRGEADAVTVKVTPELAAQLIDWSAPVQMRLVRDGDEWTMEVRTCDTTEWVP